jgi:dolichol-phosphate mannosyltransferase
VRERREEAGMIYIVLPAYNEDAVIYRTLLGLARSMRQRKVEYRAILVNDGSTDRTTAEAMRAVDESEGALDLTVLEHGRNLGLGGALRTGIFWCLDHARDDDAIVTLDADATHPAEVIPALANRVSQGFDLAIASRYQAGAVVTGVPPHRLVLSVGARIVFQSLFYFPGVRDYTCCFRAYRASALQRAQRVYGDEFMTARGFEAVTDLLLRLRQLGVRVTEVPFTLDYTHRAKRSKMRVARTVVATVALLARRFVERFTRYSPARVRMLLAGPPRPHGHRGA